MNHASHEMQYMNPHILQRDRQPSLVYSSHDLNVRSSSDLGYKTDDATVTFPVSSLNAVHDIYACLLQEAVMIDIKMPTRLLHICETLFQFHASTNSSEL